RAARGGSQLVGCGEPEADAADGVDEAGILRVVAELAAEARDVDVERLRRAEPVRVPDLVDKPLARDDGAGLGHQHVEQLEFLARQIQLLAGHARFPPRAVHTNGAYLKRGRRASAAVPGPRAAPRRRARRTVAGPPEHRANPRSHLARRERLDDVVVGAELEADDAVGLFAAGGEHDDRDLGALAKG